MGLLNFGVDFLLLLAANRLSGHDAGIKKILPAALLGGVYGCLCVLPGLFFLANTLWRCVFLFAMGGIAFGFSGGGLRRIALFVLLSMAVGGVAIGLGSGFWIMVSAAAGVCLICIFGFGGRLGTRYLPVSIQWKGKIYQFQALLDTGNTLSDPITGQRAMVVSSEIGEQLLGISLKDLRSPLTALENIEGGRLLPYHCVGMENGLILAKRFSDVTIGKKSGSCLVAFAPHELGKGEDYQALTGGVEWD